MPAPEGSVSHMFDNIITITEIHQTTLAHSSPDLSSRGIADIMTTKQTAEDHEGHVHGPDCNHHHEPQAPTVREGAKIGRNDVCPCGSSKKYKKCCGK